MERVLRPRKLVYQARKQCSFGHNMPRTLPITLATILATSLTLSACGRKAPLDPPSAVPVEKGKEQPAPPVEDKPFILDKLIQ
jgi:predicted small lipoprotein YifL